MTAKQQEQMPDEIWAHNVDGLRRYNEDLAVGEFLSPKGAKYVRADLCAPTDKEAVKIFEEMDAIYELRGSFDDEEIRQVRNALTRPSREAQLLKVIRDLGAHLEPSFHYEMRKKHAAIIEEANKCHTD